MGGGAIFYLLPSETVRKMQRRQRMFGAAFDLHSNETQRHDEGESNMEVVKTIQLGETVGAEILDCGRDQLLDKDFANECLELLDAHGVLLFRELGLDDATQVAFSANLGEIVSVSSHKIPEITVISLDPENALREYFQGAFEWHIDGSMDEIPSKCAVMTCHATALNGGDTEFASSYAAYDELTEEEKEHFAELRVIHSFEASQRRIYTEPTATQLADWASRPNREHPLVWRHQSGRDSLVLGSTASHVVGMDLDEGRALLEGLLDRATRPGRVFRHRWSVGDTVIWDNRGTIHRACLYDADSPREMHRTKIAGDEAIQ